MSPVTLRSRTRLRAALVLYLVAVAVVTLRPAPEDDTTVGLARRLVAWVAQHGLPVTFEATEAVANVVMFVPFGVLVGLLLSRPWWVVVLLGTATSTLIETVQRWLPTRFPTLQDVVMNTLGAALGVLTLMAVQRLRQRPEHAASGSEMTRPRRVDIGL